jgi:hypothetical protein
MYKNSRMLVQEAQSFSFSTHFGLDLSEKLEIDLVHLPRKIGMEVEFCGIEFHLSV